MGNKCIKSANLTKQDQTEKKTKTSIFSLFGNTRKASKVNDAVIIIAQLLPAEQIKSPLRALSDYAIKTNVPLRYHLVPRPRCPGCSRGQPFVIQAQYSDYYGVGVGSSKKEAITKAAADLVQIIKLL